MTKRKAQTDKNKTSKKAGSKSDLRSKLDAVCAAVAVTCPSEWSGDDPIMTLRSDKITRIPTFKTGSIALDKALGGGYAWGRIIEVYGPESSGKSTMMLHAIANVQMEDKTNLCALIDSENSFDPMYAQALGVNVDNLLVSQPDSGEHALNIMMELIRNDVKLIIIDSVAALTPRDMFEAPIGTVTMGKHAKMMSEGIRNLNTLLSKKRASVIFTNQLRTQIGVHNASMAGSTTGGKALRFYASQRIEIRRIGSDKEGEEIVNNIIKSKVAKNKIAPPFLIAIFKIRFGKGIDPIEQVIDFAIDFDIIEKSGAWFKIPILDDQKFQGRQNLYGFMENNSDQYQIIADEVDRMLDGGLPLGGKDTESIPNLEGDEEKEVEVNVVDENENNKQIAMEESNEPEETESNEIKVEEI